MRQEKLMKKMGMIEAMEENVALEKLERPAHARRAEDASQIGRASCRERV